MNLTYANTVLTGKVLLWKLYLQDKNFDFTYVKGKSLRQFVPDALSRLCENNMSPQQLSALLASLQPIVKTPLDILNNSIRLSSHILAAPAARDHSSRLALSDTMDSWIEKQYTLLKATQANQLKSDYHLLVE